MSAQNNRLVGNKTNKAVQKAKISYYKGRVERNSCNLRNTWSDLRKLIAKDVKRCSIGKVIIGDVAITDRVEIAQHFNEYFHSVPRLIGESTPASDFDPLSHLHNNSNLMYFFPSF